MTGRRGGSIGRHGRRLLSRGDDPQWIYRLVAELRVGGRRPRRERVDSATGVRFV